MLVNNKMPAYVVTLILADLLHAQSDLIAAVGKVGIGIAFPDGVIVNILVPGGG